MLKKIILVLLFIALFVLVIFHDKSQQDSVTKGTAVTWSGKGQNWDYQAVFTQNPSSTDCIAPKVLATVNESFTFTGTDGHPFTSFTASYKGILSTIHSGSPVSTPTPSGISSNKSYKSEHQVCFNGQDWIALQNPSSSSTITMAALPYHESTETMTIRPANQPKTTLLTKDNSVTWLGKGKNWDYQVTLVRKPNNEVSFITHGLDDASPGCPVPNAAIVVNQNLTFKGTNGKQFTSFTVSYKGIPYIVNPEGKMSYGSPSGIEPNKPFGTEHNICLSEQQWAAMKTDLSNTATVSVTAFPYQDSMETITLKTSK